MDNLKWWLDALVSFFGGLFGGTEANAAERAPESKPAQPEVAVPQAPTGIDWTDGTSMVSKYFSVKEAITLHSWDRLANATDGLDDSVKAQIFKLCKVLDEVREILDAPMSVHCIFRSVKYNQEVLHSLPHDVHSMGMAIDFDCNSHMTIAQAKEKIRPAMERLGIRMEGGTTTWIHLDTKAVGPSGREFKA